MSGRKQQKLYAGQQIGDITILQELPPHVTPNGSKQRIVECRCSCGREFTTRLSSVISKGKCSKCSFLETRRDIVGQRFGKLVAIKPADDYISPSGHRLSRFLCLCDCGNTVVANLSSLTTGKTRSCGCLQNTKGLLKDNPELLQKYDFQKNKEEGILLDRLTARSSKKVWWKCDRCHNSWLATIASQNDSIKHDCPYCSGRLVIKGKTDLLTRFPDIVNEYWDYDKNNILPDEISAYSGMKVWWKCSEGHSWRASVANKINGSGCPQCNIENVNSFCEQAVFYYIKQAFPDAINGDSHIGMELDIYIPSKTTAIEYDGSVWHNNKKKTEVDDRKNRLCADQCITLLRIREPGLSDLPGCIVFKRQDSTTEKTLDAVIMEVLQFLGHNEIPVDVKRDTPCIMEQYATKKQNNSLAHLFPELAAQWHPTKNGGLTPDRINKGSRYKAWWLCPNGHEWQAVVGGRTRPVYYSEKAGRLYKPRGCPFCSGKRVQAGYNDIQTLRPDIAEEWHPVKNGELKPSDLTIGSNKKVWWQCQNGHEWEASPNKRCTLNRGCPYCFENRRSPAVICIETNEVFSHGDEAAKKVGTRASNIYKCCRGEQKTAAGYHWSYAN